MTESKGTHDMKVGMEISPCPFCGGADVTPAGSMSRTHIWCRSCNAEGPSIWHGGPTNDRSTLNRCEAEAIAAWNTRAAKPADGWQTMDRDSFRFLRQFADMYRSGAQGCEMDFEAAQALALSIDDALAAAPQETSHEGK